MSARTAIVTGAASGIGKATTALFRERGWTAIGVDRDWSGSATDDDVELDISDLAAWRLFLESQTELDALINNAAVNVATPLGDTDVSTWSRVFKINLEAAAVATSAVAGTLSRTRGAIVNVASVHAFGTSQGMAGYAASKAGLIGLTRAAAVELGPTGVRVNAVAPGAIDSPMLLPDVHGDDREDALRKLEQRTPLGRVGAPGEIAEIVVFLADSGRSGFVTGECLIADGGALARLATE